MLMNCCRAAAFADSSDVSTVAFSATSAPSAFPACSDVTSPLAPPAVSIFAAPSAGPCIFFAFAAFSAFRAAFGGLCCFLAAFDAASCASLAASSFARKCTAPQRSSSWMSSKTTPTGILSPQAGAAEPGSWMGSCILAGSGAPGHSAPLGPFPHSLRRRRKSLRSISIATCGLYCIIGDLSAPPKSHNAKPACFRHAASAKARMKPGCRFRNSLSKNRVAT
mmetsp:Transcript_99682/g.281405  ORF Transcript_99682/g.281405 Transcript_99682/m.281405 type:complete len:222 (+) Transcript_99682:307-972(+)